ncbi:hypothetical protein I6F26_24780 [Ensifer sp. IC3342]|nr:hypothetical protein [Ensifer sp. IC4062]MCA1408208.1 hypothetical protein [Ensifer sp. BRP08]MCA1440828.1 hypothetical protein [Ensifer sp. IC4062]MCA1449778.1 hypothetical protein [Ensifer sp. IC3342]
MWKATLLSADNKPHSTPEEIKKAAWPTDNDPYVNGINYARNLADLYMEQASKASTAKDFAAAGLLGSAGVAAGGLLYGSHLDLIKGAGLAAGAITSTTSYTKQDVAEDALLRGAEALICVAGVAQKETTAFQNNTEAAGVVSDATLRIRLNVRKKLIRQVPEYSALVDRLKIAAALPPPTGDARTVANVDVLRAQTAECIIRAGA